MHTRLIKAFVIWPFCFIFYFYNEVFVLERILGRVNCSYNIFHLSKMLVKVFLSGGSKTIVDDQIAAVPASEMM